MYHRMIDFEGPGGLRDRSFAYSAPGEIAFIVHGGRGGWGIVNFATTLVDQARGVEQTQDPLEGPLVHVELRTIAENTSGVSQESASSLMASGLRQLINVGGLESFSELLPGRLWDQFSYVLGDWQIEAPIVYTDDDAEKSEVSLEMRLVSAFETEPVEDGFHHPAEEVLRTSLKESRGSAMQWIRSLALDPVRPSFSASILQCLGRLPDPGSLAWRKNLIRDALKQGGVEVRDAAIQAAELWEDQGVLDIPSGP